MTKEGTRNISSILHIPTGKIYIQSEKPFWIGISQDNIKDKISKYN